MQLKNFVASELKLWVGHRMYHQNFTPLDKVPKLWSINQFIVSSFYLYREIKRKFQKRFFQTIDIRLWSLQGFPETLNLVSAFFIFSPNDSPQIVIKNAFYFIWKYLFILQIFKFLYFCLLLFLPIVPFFWRMLENKSHSLLFYDIMNFLN